MILLHINFINLICILNSLKKYQQSRKLFSLNNYGYHFKMRKHPFNFQEQNFLDSYQIQIDLKHLPYPITNAQYGSITHFNWFLHSMVFLVLTTTHLLLVLIFLFSRWTLHKFCKLFVPFPKIGNPKNAASEVT